MSPVCRSCIVLLVSSLTAIIGCGFGSSKEEAADASLRVSLLTSLPLSGRWERAAERGLGRIAADLDADVVRLRSLESVDQRDLVVEQGRRGMGLVFCVGPGFENIVFAEAHSYPETNFVLLPGRAYRDNVASVDFVFEDAAWVAGVVSASLGSSRTVGVIRGVGGAWLEEVESAFVAGFRSTDVRREAEFVNPPDGPWQLAARDVKVALYATGWPEPEVLAAAHDAGVLLVTIGTDVMEGESDVVAAAIKVDVAEAMVRIARDVHDGVFVGSVYTLDLGSGVLDVRLNRSLPDVNLPSVHEALEVARSEVTAGIVELEGLGM
jgi:basic membrane lipoprotein Med (substrate-binding protein (PBP1-ABC) superfamily)